MKKWALYSTSHLKHNNKVPCIFWARFPGSSGVKRVCLQCWRARLNPWVGKILWRRKWQTTPLFLPGEFHGQRSLLGYTVHGVTKRQTLLKQLIHPQLAYTFSPAFPFSSLGTRVAEMLSVSHFDSERLAVGITQGQYQRWQDHF